MNNQFKAKIQVGVNHYDFQRYMSKERWISVWHQLNEVIALKPDSVLEIGPGSGIFKIAGQAFGLNIQTLDVDPALNPDYIGTAEDIPLHSDEFDVVCAFQVLEHMPFEKSKKALSEMARVAKKAVVISLPDVTTSWASSMSIPKIGKKSFVINRYGYKPQPHVFDGEHYWEIGKKII